MTAQHTHPYARAVFSDHYRAAIRLHAASRTGPLRVIVAGSRSLDLPTIGRTCVHAALGEMYRLARDAKGATSAGITPAGVLRVLSGAAKGPDQFAIDWAKNSSKYGISLSVFRAQWADLGKAAGVLRNIEMAKRADALLLFWDGVSRGSARMLGEALARGLLVVPMMIEFTGSDPSTTNPSRESYLKVRSVSALQSPQGPQAKRDIEDLATILRRHYYYDPGAILPGGALNNHEESHEQDYRSPEDAGGWSTLDWPDLITGSDDPSP